MAGVSLLISSALTGLTAARAAGYLTPAQGRFNELITGRPLAVLSTKVLSNALTASFRAPSGILSGAANPASAAGTAVGRGAVQTDLVQNLLSGLDEQDIGQIIADGSPELSTEQATAATRLVSGIIRRASNDLGQNLNDVSNLGDFVTNRVNSITTALFGADFVNRPQRQGLSQTEAQATAISPRAEALKQQAQDAAAATERIARTTANTAVWGFLLALGLILGFGTLGDGLGADLPKRGAAVDHLTEVGQYH